METLEHLRPLNPDTGDLHLNHAGVSPLSAPAARAITDAVALMSRGSLGVPEIVARVDAARGAVGRLVGAEAADVAFFPTCAAAISQAALGLTLRPGDEIVLPDQEYPSNAYPWYRAAERHGAVVRRVASGPDFTLETSAVIEAIGPRTRVVACSWVQFQTGATLDLAAIAEAAHRRGALLVVDAIQGLGVLPFDLASTGVDIVCGGGHKWLLGPLGFGFLAARPKLVQALEPALYGAMTYGTPDDPVDPRRPARGTAKRFEPGAPPALTAPSAAAAILGLVEVGIDRVANIARARADLLAEGLLRRGYVLRTRSAFSPIVTFVPRREPEALAADLRARRCGLVVRAGGVRVSPHGTTRPEEIERLLTLLDELDR